ncbi:MAG: hypothetical protein ACOC3X_00360 [Nanoarchaeota archaeon]
MKAKKTNLIIGISLLIIIVLKMTGILNTFKLTGLVDIALIVTAIYLIVKGL